MRRSEGNGGLDGALSGDACRAARALLKWSVLELAHQARVSPNTIVKLENGSTIRAKSAMRIRARFAHEGVELLDEPMPGARVRH
ncbi:MAG: helix-turn-helix domain-containing protein [Ignavibacteriales bacterium]